MSPPIFFILFFCERIFTLWWQKKIGFLFLLVVHLKKMEFFSEILKSKNWRKENPGCYLGQSLWSTNQTQTFPLIGPIGGHCIMAITLYKSKTGFHTIWSTWRLYFIQIIVYKPFLLVRVEMLLAEISCPCKLNQGDSNW